MGAFLQKKHTSAAVITLILSLTAATESSLTELFGKPAVAQSNSQQTTFSVPASVPSGTQVKIKGSTSMEAINEALKKGFEGKYSGTSVQVETSSSESGLQALKDGKTDVAAIGRALSVGEKGEGIKELPVSLHKIAIIVGADSPFKGNLTIDQFAKIFRGEITNWSQVGGPDAPVRLVDRPATSETRQAFERYPVFQSAPFTTGATAIPVEQDNTDAVVEKLGQDGVGYAIAAQVLGNPNVHILEMHKTPPTDPKYPFSQPLGYAYKEPLSNPGTEAFLGYTAAPDNDALIATASQQSVGAARADGTTGTSGASNPGTGSTENTDTGATGTTDATGAAAPKGGGFNPWWLAPLALVPLLWWGLGRKRNENEEYVPPAPLTAVGGDTGLPGSTGLTSDTRLTTGTGFSGDTGLTSNTGLTSGLPNMDTANLEPTAAGTSPRGTGLSGLATGTISTGAAAVAGATAAGMAGVQALGGRAKSSHIILTPRGARSAYAYWEVPDAQRPTLPQEKLALRLYDVTDGKTHQQAPLVGTFETEADDDLIIPLPASDRDYQTEIGYTNRAGNWVSLARSNTIHEDANSFRPSLDTGMAPTEGGEMMEIGTAAATTSFGATTLVSSRVTGSRMILTPRGSKSAYAYWEIPASQRPSEKLTLRVYDMTDVDPALQSGSLIGEFETEADDDLIVPLPTSDRTYQSELGYTNDQGRWVRITQSNAIDVEATNPMNRFFEAASATVIGAGAGIAGIVGQSGEALMDAASNVRNSAETVLSGLGETAENLRDSTSNAVSGAVNRVETMLSGIGDNTTAISHSDKPENDSLFDDISVDTVIGKTRTENDDPDGDMGGIAAMGAAVAGLAGGLDTMAGNVDSTRHDVGGGIVDQVRDTVDNIGTEVTELSTSTPDQTDTRTNDIGNAETELGTSELLSRSEVIPNSRVIFIARSATSGYAYWELTDAHQHLLQPLGTNELKLRLYDVTGLTGQRETPRGVYQVDCQTSDRDQHLSIPVTDRDYMVEVGYTQDDGRWVAIAASEQIHFSSEITRLL